MDAPAKPLPRKCEVHLWVLPRAEGALAALCHRGDELLSPDEQAYHRLIAQPARARRYLLSRIMLRQALASHLACDPADLVFSRTANGKILTERAACAGIDFSLTHSFAGTVLAVAPAAGVGVDWEPLRRAPAVRRIAAHCFHEAERRQIDTAGDRADNVALSLWALKESAVKAAGRTIWEGLRNFAFDVTHAEPTWLTKPPLGESKDWWLFIKGFGRDDQLAVTLWRPAQPCAMVVQYHVLGEQPPPQTLAVDSGSWR